MASFEIIVRSNGTALKLTLPEEVVDRIKEISSMTEKEFNGLNNEKVLNVIVKSLDRVLFGFDHTHIHESQEIKTQHGRIGTSKQQE